MSAERRVRKTSEWSSGAENVFHVGTTLVRAVFINMSKPRKRRRLSREGSKVLCSSLVAGFACLLLCPPAFTQSNDYQQAVQRYEKKDYTSALSLEERALQQDKNDARWRHLYGLTLAALGRFPEGEDNLRRAVASEPQQATFCYDLGYVLYQEKKYAEAFDPLKRAIELDGDNLQARFLLGRVYVSAYPVLGNPDFIRLSLEQFEFIAKKDERYPLVHYHLALLHGFEGKLPEEREELLAQLKYYPHDVEARVELGEVLLKMGQTRNALDQLLRAEKQAPEMSLVHFDLAKVYRRTHQTAQALEAARKCVELDPQFADGHYLLGQLYRETDQPELAQREIERFHQLQGKP
jgi:tetratricopeptide (TPR) repeat protein